MTEDNTTETEEGVAPSGETPDEPQGNPGAPQPKPFKKKRYFPEDKCGLVKCSREADGYISGTKPTGKDKSILWFGPACTKCVRTWHDALVPMTLAELAHQRNGASDLALVLDVEVGEMKRRLEAAGIDEKGRPLEEAAAAGDYAGLPVENVEAVAREPVPVVTAEFGEEPVWPAGSPPPATPPAAAPLAAAAAPAAAAPAAANTEVVSEQGSIALEVASVTIPAAELLGECDQADALYAQITPFHIVDQNTMDLAGGILRDVKGVWNRIETARLALGAPLRARLKQIQEHYVPVLERLAAVEGLLKTKIKEGSDRAAAQQAQALAAAQAAYQTGNPADMAQATQAAVGAEVALPQGVSTRTVREWRIVDAAQVPLEMYSIDSKKIQAAVDAGYPAIPGIEIYDRQIFPTRAS